jgi:F-type H+-transporting ATPase subunit gamma
METVEQLHEQLDNVSQLRGIVKTMKALSAASIRQYQQASAALDGYYRSVELGLHVVLRELHGPPPLTPASGQARAAAVVFGSDHGLCGRFNEEAAGSALTWLAQFPEPLVLAVGARAQASLEQAGETVQVSLLAPAAASQIVATVEHILLQLDAWQEAARRLQVRLFYNRPLHSGGYRPAELELLPLSEARLQQLEVMEWPSRLLPTFTMDAHSLLASLLHQYLFAALSRACADSQASEHASRLAAMQSAQRNLDERIEELTRIYRRARQNNITAQLLDIVSGFEVVAPGQS